MERDTSSDQGGDQAVWQDLVARLELPQAVDPASAPWPDRENLTPARHAKCQQPKPAPEPEHGTGEPRNGRNHDAAVTRRRIIRPATFLRFAEASQQAEASQHLEPAGLDQDSPSSDASPASDASPDRNSSSASDSSGGDGLGGGLDFQDLADLEFSDENDGERYVPPQIPPLPKLDPVARGAWTALFGGPGYLFLATTLSWQVPGWAELAAIIAFITGFVVLVSRLGDGPSRRDGPDQGAVV